MHYFISLIFDYNKFNNNIKKIFILKNLIKDQISCIYKLIKIILIH